MSNVTQLDSLDVDAQNPDNNGNVDVFIAEFFQSCTTLSSQQFSSHTNIQHQQTIPVPQLQQNFTPDTKVISLLLFNI